MPLEICLLTKWKYFLCLLCSLVSLGYLFRSRSSVTITDKSKETW